MRPRLILAVARWTVVACLEKVFHHEIGQL
jgi:hypothetical protein